MCLMDKFLFLNWNKIVLKHFLVSHVKFLFLLHFYLHGNWYYCAHHLAPYNFLSSSSILLLRSLECYLSLFYYLYLVLLSELIPPLFFSNFVASVRTLFKCIFINVLTYLIFPVFISLSTQLVF